MLLCFCVLTFLFSFSIVKIDFLRYICNSILTADRIVMTAKDIFELRQQGRKEEAYEAARTLYAADKSPYVSLAMFWTAVDILRLRVGEGRLDEANKIFLALERLLPNVPDRSMQSDEYSSLKKDGRVHDAFSKCRDLLEMGNTSQRLQEDGPAHLQMGVWGEELATEYLSEKGYVILERDWHSGHRDIDIIAQQDGCIVFVEVKTRRSNDFGNPELAVDYNKQHNLLRAINHYIHYCHLNMPWRFDVITIVGIPGHYPEIEHIEDFQLHQR